MIDVLRGRFIPTSILCTLNPTKLCAHDCSVYSGPLPCPYSGVLFSVVFVYLQCVSVFCIFVKESKIDYMWRTGNRGNGGKSSCQWQLSTITHQLFPASL